MMMDVVHVKLLVLGAQKIIRICCTVPLAREDDSVMSYFAI